MPENSAAGKRAQIPNPALAGLGFLVGTWDTIGSHPMLPGVELKGRSTFEWIEGGAFLMMRTQVFEEKFPDGLAIFGSDDSSGKVVQMYFDERKVSRHFDVTIADGEVQWHRDDPKLSQRLTIVRKSHDRLESEGLMSENGGLWTDDLSQTFLRS